ncbi:hypothetical protein CXG81DRAFT_8618 [Caulochytrium protostelioides]|uniref:Ubiquitin-related modifier 1 n=1 Tax=Caulochytrium protostelioides TaxID=1555241 RepID=A0A4P9XEV3_9FUNG|nr:ubiquitin-related modifier 1 [Caulochytrium protostelioides]RKP04106.1 hypothetical protein CXG81DRAFT_8618 [Caulochytrium protostelioides]|eukprot:RKP04106.1 hypothetical protein CXG81DRAFT_8618 [Caulochytrium protostelioides]
MIVFYLISGGLELLFDNQKSLRIGLPLGTEQTSATMKELISFIVDAGILKERPELFKQNDTVRPGILVLINEADWELEGELDYVLKPNDEIVFISTLHGG